MYWTDVFNQNLHFEVIFFCCESHPICKFNFVDFSIKKKQAICQPWMKKMKIATQPMGSKFRSLSKLLIIVKPAKRSWSRKVQWVGWTATTYRTGYEMLLMKKKKALFDLIKRWRPKPVRLNLPKCTMKSAIWQTNLELRDEKTEVTQLEGKIDYPSN